VKPRRLPWWARLRLHLDSLDRYHAGAASVLAAGVLCGFMTVALDREPVWVGFLAGAVPMFVFVALAYSLPD
jgi:hypothetical protein